MKTIDICPPPSVNADFRHLTGLDILRLLLCGAVVYYHFLLPRPSSGPVAVIGFFVLSGFLSAYSLAGKSLDVQRFYANKARRLLPTFVSSMTLAIILTILRLLTDPAFPTLHHAFGSVWKLMEAGHFSYLHIVNIFNTPAWYMYGEAACVALFPFFFAALGKRSAFIILFLFFLGVAALQFTKIPWATPFGGGLYFDPLCRLWQFMAGMACFSLIDVYWPRLLRIALPTFFLTVLTAALILLQENDLHYINYTFPFDLCVTCLYVLLIPVLARMEFPKLKNRGGAISRAGLAKAASLTYGIYLIHVPVLHFLEHLHPNIWFFPGETACLAVAATILLAIVNKRWWENRWICPQGGIASASRCRQ